MKTLQERMTEMKPYFRGVEMFNEALIVKVIYPSKWQAYPSKDNRIKVTPSDSNPNESYYYASSEDTTYDDMFDLIEETIKVNSETALKLKLLTQKVEELKELFSERSYEDLLTMTFAFENKPKRKYVKKAKKDKIVNNKAEAIDIKTSESDNLQDTSNITEENNIDEIKENDNE